MTWIFPSMGNTVSDLVLFLFPLEEEEEEEIPPNDGVGYLACWLLIEGVDTSILWYNYSITHSLYFIATGKCGAERERRRRRKGIGTHVK